MGPQDYTLIKMRALELPGKLAALEGAGPVFLMAATLRPVRAPGFGLWRAALACARGCVRVCCVCVCVCVCSRACTCHLSVSPPSRLHLPHAHTPAGDHVRPDQLLGPARGQVRRLQVRPCTGAISAGAAPCGVCGRTPDSPHAAGWATATTPGAVLLVGRPPPRPPRFHRSPWSWCAACRGPGPCGDTAALPGCSCTPSPPRGLDGEVYIMTYRSALNLSFQVRSCARVRACV